MIPKRRRKTGSFDPFSSFLAAKGFVLLDGGLATELEAAGHELNDPLWSAKVLLEDSEAVAAVHRAFLEAGADCISTATYQATFQGLARRGISGAQAEGVFRRAVEIAVRVRDDFWAEAGGSAERVGRPRPLVAASVGPYGAYLADGSEYRGRYAIGVAELAAFHRRRWQVLADSPADLIAAETIPCLDEARVLGRLAAETPSKPAWLSFCCRDGSRLASGVPLARAGVAASRLPGVSAVGINCTAPAHLPSAVAALSAATDKPVFAYPNAGGDYDAETKRWDSNDGGFDWEAACRSWIQAGAVAVGGCCRVGPAVIRRMGAALEEDFLALQGVSPTVHRAKLPGATSGR